MSCRQCFEALEAFGAHYTASTIRKPPNSTGNHLGPYITMRSPGRFWINDQTEPSERGQMYGRLNAATNIEGRLCEFGHCNIGA